MTVPGNFSRSVILVVGGDGRQGDRHIGATLIRAVASTKSGGSGDHRALIAAVRGGNVRAVLLLVRWLGHSESRAITSTCRSVGVRCRIVRTGMSAAWDIAREEVERG